MKSKKLGLGIVSALLILSACSSNKESRTKMSESQLSESSSYSMPVSQEGLSQMTASWPAASKAAINHLNAKYGLPSSITDEMVVWNNTPPFKRSIVYKEEINQQFPIPHSDVLQQYLSYKVPVNKVDELSKFDGSIMIDRTKGEISTRNDKEEMNILSFNLADKIIRGEISTEEARRLYFENAKAFSYGNTNPLITELAFKSQTQTSDPDQVMQSQEKPSEILKTNKINPEEVEKIIEEEED